MRLFYIPLLLLSGITVFGQDAVALRRQNFNLQDGIALQGYDPVSYFTEKKAVKGDGHLSLMMQGVTYYFSSVQNKERFKSNPEQYEPQYGGWCAYAMGKNGSRVEVDPATFKIINGKLYLFYNRYFNNTLKSWDKDQDNLKTRADANWQKIFPK